MVIVDEVHLAVEEAQNDRTIPSRKLRSFQKEFSVCAKDEEAEVIQLIAPTGAGKTLCFENLMRDENEEIHKTVLIYPTNALIKSQLERFRKNKFAVINISSKNLTKKGEERSRELFGLLSRYDIVLTNPDIFQAILGHMYRNQTGDLIQAFHFFEYVIYDEFHTYKEFELSGILNQIGLFLNMSPCKVILSSATPKKEIIGLLKLTRIGSGANRHEPRVKTVEAKPCSNNEGEIIRYKTKVNFRQGKIIDDFDEIVGKLKEYIQDINAKEPRILFIFDKVRDSNWFYSRLFQEHPELYEYAEKDNGYDTNQEGDTQDLTKPILISTNKSELGLDYPIKYLYMEDGFSIDSFVQRFGRAARREPAECFIYTKKEANPLFTEEIIDYEKFVENMKHITKEYNIQTKKVTALFTLRQALAISEYKNERKRDLEEFFAPESGFSYKFWLFFFSMLNNYREHEYIDVDFERLESFVEDIKSACKSLRGRSLQFPVTYQRGHEIRRTMYDVLSVLNQVPATVRMTQGGLEIVEEKSDYQGPFIQAMTLSYLPAPINYQKRNGQFRDEIDIIARRALDAFPEKQKKFMLFCIHSLCNAADADRVVIPQEVILWNNKVIPLNYDAMEFDDN
jgi:CRISPR-associated endonuclease/helicase Cas3